MTMKGAMVIQANAVTVVDGVILLTTPYVLSGMARAFFSNAIANRGADLLDPHCGKGRGDVEGRVDVMLKVSEGISTGEVG